MLSKLRALSGSSSMMRGVSSAKCAEEIEPLFLPAAELPDLLSCERRDLSGIKEPRQRDRNAFPVVHGFHVEYAERVPDAGAGIE